MTESELQILTNHMGACFEQVRRELSALNDAMTQGFKMLQEQAADVARRTDRLDCKLDVFIQEVIDLKRRIAEGEANQIRQNEFGAPIGNMEDFLFVRMDGKRNLTERGFVKIVGAGLTTVRKFRKEGMIQCRRFGSRVYYLYPDDVLDWHETMRKAPIKGVME